MTRETIKKALENLLNEHGFPFEYSKWYGWLPNVPQKSSDYLSISIREGIEYSNETHSLVSKISACASVCRMNPNSGTEELFRAADEIRKGAELVSAINALNLTCAERL